jgi:Immunoglobulin-like domain of bacterial spore germination
MDPINPIAGNPEALNQNTEAPKVPQPQKDNHWISILAMAIFVILALGIVAFLYYQNQQLKGMLASYIPTATPVASTSPTTNPNLPTVSSPSANMKVISPLKVAGTVPTGWMFEGVFPIKLLDSTQKVLAQGQAKEKVAGSWQSGNPVDFTATLTFKAASGSGSLVLSNDNPSGNPATAKTFEVPINF